MFHIPATQGVSTVLGRLQQRSLHQNKETSLYKYISGNECCFVKLKDYIKKINS